MRGGMLRRVIPAFLAFVLVAAGVLVLVSHSKTSSAITGELQPTLVATVAIPKGTSADQISSMVEVRMVSPNSRAAGAFSSVDELAPGIIGADHVAGQQILRTSFGPDPRSALGNGLVAVSVKLTPAQWTGPTGSTGNRVNVFAIGTANAELIALNVIVLDAPDASTLTPEQETVVTLGVPDSYVSRVIGAASGAGIWLVTATST
jgi:hypothetical protein